MKHLTTLLLLFAALQFCYPQAEEDQVYMVVENMPEFPGGDKAMLHYISTNLKYPAYAQKNGIHGRVYVNFVINKQGGIEDVKVLRGIGGGCDEEAVRVVKDMPRWKPGMQRGKKVKVSYNLPIKFILDDGSNYYQPKNYRSSWLKLELVNTVNANAALVNEDGSYVVLGDKAVAYRPDGSRKWSADKVDDYGAKLNSHYLLSDYWGLRIFDMNNGSLILKRESEKDTDYDIFNEYLIRLGKKDISVINPRQNRTLYTIKEKNLYNTTPSFLNNNLMLFIKEDGFKAYEVSTGLPLWEQPWPGGEEYNSKDGKYYKFTALFNEKNNKIEISYNKNYRETKNVYILSVDPETGTYTQMMGVNYDLFSEGRLLFRKTQSGDEQIASFDNNISSVENIGSVYNEPVYKVTTEKFVFLMREDGSHYIKDGIKRNENTKIKLGIWLSEYAIAVNHYSKKNNNNHYYSTDVYILNEYGRFDKVSEFDKKGVYYINSTRDYVFMSISGDMPRFNIFKIKR